MRISKLTLGLLIGGGIASITLATPAIAEARSITSAYDIPSQSLDRALNSFAEKSRLQIMFDPALVQGRRSTALRGRFSAAEGLRRLLDGTGLAATTTAGGVYMVKAARPGEYRVGSRPEPGSDAGGTSENGGGVDADIIVTAQKREQRLFDVPLAISAIRGSELQSRQLKDFTDFAAQVPGLSLQQTQGSFNRIIIRGQNSGGAAATTANVVDDVPYTFSGSASASAFLNARINSYDLDRVEVLRGPQGTLYGASALGGIIKYVTNAPKIGSFKAGAQLGAESIRGGETTGSAKGFVNIPLLDDAAALRVTGYYDGIAGYVDNKLAGVRDVNGGSNWGVRGSILVKPIEGFRARLTAFYQDYSIGDTGQVNVVGAALTPAAPPANALDLVDGFNNNNRFLGKSRIKSQIYSADLGWDVGGATITSITSYSKYDTVYDADFSASQVIPGLTYGQVLGGFYGQASGLATIGGNQAAKLEKVTQELRVASNPGSTLLGQRVDWQIGGFYTNEDVSTRQIFNGRGVPNGEPLTLPFPIGGNLSDSRYREYAIFGETTLYLDDTFDVALGGRWSTNNQSAQSSAPAGFLSGGVAATGPVYKSSEDVFTWSVAPRLHLGSDTLIYGRVASGYRPGGPNVTSSIIPANLVAFKSSTTTNYELGLRTALLDKRVTIDVAAFQIDWKDVQVIVRTPNPDPNQPPFTLTGNGGAARSKGIEWTLGFAPVPGLRFTDVGAYTDAEFTQPVVSIDAPRGGKLAYVPDFTNTLNIHYETRAFADYKATIGGSWSYVGRRFTDFIPAGATITSHVRLPSYSTFSVRVGLDNDRFNVQLYANNLTDTRTPVYFSSGDGNAFTGQATYLQPRTIGLAVGFKY